MSVSSLLTSEKTSAPLSFPRLEEDFEHHCTPQQKKKRKKVHHPRTRIWPSPHVWLFFTGRWPLLWQTERKWSIWPCLSLSRKYIPPSVPVFVAAGRAYPSLCFKAMGLILIPGAGCITHLLYHFSLTPSSLSHFYLSHTHTYTQKLSSLHHLFASSSVVN